MSNQACNHLDVVDVSRELHRIANGTGEMLDKVDEGLENVLALFDGCPLSLASIAFELRRLNDNLEAGTINIRTHHPLCVTPKDGDYTVQQLEVMGKYLNQSIDTGALALPQKGGE